MVNFLESSPEAFSDDSTVEESKRRRISDLPLDENIYGQHILSTMTEGNSSSNAFSSFCSPGLTSIVDLSICTSHSGQAIRIDESFCTPTSRRVGRPEKRRRGPGRSRKIYSDDSDSVTTPVPRTDNNHEKINPMPDILAASLLTPTTSRISLDSRCRSIPFGSLSVRRLDSDSNESLCDSNENFKTTLSHMLESVTSPTTVLIETFSNTTLRTPVMRREITLVGSLTEFENMILPDLSGYKKCHGNIMEYFGAKEFFNEIPSLWNNSDNEPTEQFIFMYLSLVARKAGTNVSVVNPNALNPEINSATNKIYDFKQNAFNYHEGTNILLLPIVFPNHFALIIHTKNRKTIFYDSKPDRNRLCPTYVFYSADRTHLIKEAINKLVNDIEIDNIEIEIALRSSYTEQTDGVNCGFFVCLYAEAYLFNNGDLNLEPLVILRERKRILLNAVNCFKEGDGFKYLSRYAVGNRDLSENGISTCVNNSESASHSISNPMPVSNTTESALNSDDGIIDLDKYADVDYTNPLNREQFLPGLRDRVLVESLQSVNDGQWLNDEIINTSFWLISESVPGINVGCIYNYQIDAVDRTVGTMWRLDNPLSYYQKLIIPAHVSASHWIFLGIEIQRREIIIYDSLNKTFPQRPLPVNLNFAQKVVRLLQRNAEFYGLDGFRDWQIYERHGPKQSGCTECGVFTIVSAECFVKNKEMTFSMAAMPGIRQRIRHIFGNFLTVNEKWFFVQPLRPFLQVDAQAVEEPLIDYRGKIIGRDNAQEPITQGDLDNEFEVVTIQITIETPCSSPSSRRSARISDQQQKLHKILKGKILKTCKKTHNCAVSNWKTNIMHKPDYFTVGKMGDKVCRWCENLLWPKESSQICCRNGKVVLPPLTDHPEKLKNLLMGIDKDGKHFVASMAHYNTVLSFASIHYGRNPSPEGGPLAILANGEFHRQISSMFAGKAQVPSFSQLWILDPETAQQHRIANSVFTEGPKLREKLLKDLTEMLEYSHPASQIYKHAKQQFDELVAHQDPQNPEPVHFFRLTLLNARQAPASIQDKSLHPNQIMHPSTGHEMFAVWASYDELPPPMNGIWVEDKEGQLHELASFSPWADSLAYELIFPSGDDGWRRGIKYVDREEKVGSKGGIEVDDEAGDEADDISECESVASTESNASNKSVNSYLETGSKYYDSNVSIRDFYRYRFAIRQKDLDYHPILSCGGGLGQKFVLDIAARVDQQVADYLRKNVDIRSTTAPNLLRYMIEQYNNQQKTLNGKFVPKNVDDIGKVVLFNSKNPGKRAYWQRMFNDCTTILAKVYDPRYARFFITVTNNREWPEFCETIYKNGQMFTDRFDTWMRVWKLKMDEFHRELDEEHLFGEVLGFGESTEYQNRGGAHIHRVMQSNVLSIPEVIEDYIWAHIPPLPDKDDDTEIAKMFRELRGLMKLQLHSCAEDFCGQLDHLGRCKKRFPEPFSNVTILYPDRPAQYYRPSPDNNGETITISRGTKTQTFDNRWVIPYNPYVLMKYRVHHDILFAYGSKANIKYAMKYPFKGPGFAYLECKEVGGKVDVDEPAQYAKMNFRAATEAYGTRIQSIPYARTSHHVVSLDIHLPGEQKVYFKVGKVEQAADEVKSGALRNSKLSSYWQLWSEGKIPKDMLFETVPEKYRWDNGKKSWIEYQRKQNKRPPIGRLNSVPPNQQQRFALYLLTKHYPGDPDHLCGVKLEDKTEKHDFVEAAMKRGLLENDNIWAETLREASLKRWPRELRWLFVSILAYGKPNNALALWEEFKDQMFNKNWPTSLKEDMALSDLERMLGNFGMNCLQFNLPEPSIAVEKNQENDLAEFFFPQEEDTPVLNTDLSANSRTGPFSFTPSQQEVYEKVIEGLKADSTDKRIPRKFFVYGEAGTGKTSLFREIIHRMRHPPLSMKVIVCASTGTAAILLPGGSTAHSIFRLGHKVSIDQPPTFTLEIFFAKRIREASLIIVDEITMLHNTIITLIDRICREVAPPTNKDIPFGGKVVIFSGDFKQSLPVVRHGGQLAQVAACFQWHELYNDFTKIKLRENCRVLPGEKEFLKLLRDIGTGAHGEYFWIPPEYVVQSRKELIDFVYPNFEEFIKDPRRLLKHLILAPHNETVDAINKELLKRIPGEERRYMAALKPLSQRPLDVNAIESETAALYLRKDIGMPPHDLRIKVGSVVVLLQNHNKKEGLINGTRFIVREMHNHYIVGEVITGSSSRVPTLFFIGRTRSEYEDEGSDGVKYESTQFPLKPAFAMTITKGQGQTVDCEGLDLTQDVFAHGQLYSAWSRVTSGKGIRVFAPFRQIDKRGYTRVQNVVAKQLILE